MLKIQGNPMDHYAINNQSAKNHSNSGFFSKELQMAKEMETVEARKKQRDTYCRSNSDYLDSLELEEKQKTLPEKTDEKANEQSEHESKTNTNIIVNPDGTRVLVITTKVGGMETSTSIELAKNTGLPRNTDSQEEAEVGAQIEGADLGEVT